MNFSEKNIKDYILSKNRGIILLDASSRSGKSLIVRSLHLTMPKSIVTSGETFYDTLIESCKNAKDVSAIYDHLTDYKCLFIEDFDFYGGRPKTESVFAEIFNRIALQLLIVITGIDIRQKMPYMLKSLENYDYYVKKNMYWIKEN